MENKNSDYEEAKGCLFPAIIVVMVMVMAFVTITCVNNRIKKVEATQDTILKTIRGYDWTSTSVVDSTVDSTATDSSVVADDEYCEDCESDEAQDEPRVYVCSGRYAKRYHRTPYCDGLQSCKGITVNMALSEAKNKGLTPCHRCARIQVAI